MSKEIRASIDETFGFEAVHINSALVSAQNRQRLYWVGKRNANGGYDRVKVAPPANEVYKYETNWNTRKKKNIRLIA